MTTTSHDREIEYQQQLDREYNTWLEQVGVEVHYVMDEEIPDLIVNTYTVGLNMMGFSDMYLPGDEMGNKLQAKIILAEVAKQWITKGNVVIGQTQVAIGRKPARTIMIEPIPDEAKAGALIETFPEMMQAYSGHDHTPGLVCIVIPNRQMYQGVQ